MRFLIGAFTRKRLELTPTCIDRGLGDTIEDFRGDSPNRAAFRVGPWEAYPKARRLVRNGAEVKVSPRSMNVLGYLAERAGEAVTHQELIAEFWRGAISSPNAVHKCIAELRRAFSDEASYIETVPKRGYRLIGPVTRLDKALAVDAGHRRPSVAVLRFVNVGGNPQTEYLAFGIAEALLDALARVPHIGIASRTNAFQFDSTATRVQDIGVALGVDHVLEGSVQLERGVLRAVVQLIRAKDGYHLFSTKVDRSLEDIFQVQDEIADEVVKHLKIHIDDGERRRMLDWGTLNVDAYLLALEGWYHNKKWSEDDARRAMVLFDRALELDDGLVWAYVGAVDAMFRLHSYVGYAECKSLGPRAVSYRNRAALHGASAERLHWMDFAALVFEGRGHRAAELMLRRRIASTGGSPEELRQYGRLLGGAGLFDEGLRYMAPAQAAPDMPWTELEVVAVESAQRGIAWSIAARRDVLTRHPEATGHTAQLVMDLAKVGEFREARAYLSRVQAIDTSGKLAFSAEAHLRFLSGEAPYGSSAFEQLMADPRNSNYTRGQLCLIAGDIVRGCGYWRKLVGASLSHLSYHIHMSEHYFASDVVNHADYQNVLDELGIGRRWTAFLRECVQELAPVTGIELTTVV